MEGVEVLCIFRETEFFCFLFFSFQKYTRRNKNEEKEQGTGGLNRTFSHRVSCFVFRFSFFCFFGDRWGQRQKVVILFCFRLFLKSFFEAFFLFLPFSLPL